MNTEFSLVNKRILFIGIGFYDYDQAIKAKIEELGGCVSYICSVTYDTTYRTLKALRLNKIALKYAQRKRVKSILNTASGNDYVFIIKGEGLTQEDVDLIKSRNPGAKNILYFWDDLKRIANREILLKNFSTIWSFDPEDCKNYGFKFRPLFYRDNISINPHKKYFISSIGWCHSNRLELFRKLAAQLKRDNKKFFLKLYVSPKTYFINRYIKRSYKPSDRELLVTKPMKFADVMKIISESECVLDIPHPSQNGLSIRTIESLRSGNHIFTTNKSIEQDSDIPQSRYTIISLRQAQRFEFTANQEDYDCGISKRYSLDSFIKDLFK